MKSIVKKIISVVFAVVFIVSALIFGVEHHSDAADVGVRITTKVPAHGHSGPLDGGVLKPNGCVVVVNDIAHPHADQIMSAATPTWNIIFYGEDLDVQNMHSNGSFTIPFGFNYATFSCLVTLQTTTTINPFSISLTRNGAIPIPTLSTVYSETSLSHYVSAQINSPIRSVSQGDVWRVYVSGTWTSSSVIDGNDTACNVILYR